MSDTMTSLVVTTMDARQEVQVPLEFIDTDTTTPSTILMSYLRELGITYPEGGMITEIESGYVFHEVPKFG